MIGWAFWMCHENVYAAQFLFVGNPYESTIFAYIPTYVKNHTGKCLVWSPICSGWAFWRQPKKCTQHNFCFWATLMRAQSLHTYLLCQKSNWEMLSLVSNPLRLSFLERAEKVYAAQFLFVGNPYESTIYAYIHSYLKNYTGKCLVWSLLCSSWAFWKEPTLPSLFHSSFGNRSGKVITYTWHRWWLFYQSHKWQISKLQNNFH